MRKTIYEMDWEKLLPETIRRDKRIDAMAKAIAEQKRKIAQEIWRVKIWENIDRMPEEILDILAYDFKVDWYDYDYPIAIKRELLKSNYYVHKKMGTKSAVEEAMSGIYKNTRVEEWWEYGAEPYRFRVVVDSGESMTDYENMARAIKKVQYYKNIRSVFDAIRFYARKEMKLYFGTGIYGMEVGKMTVLAREAGDYYVDETGEILLDGDGSIIYA